MVARSFLSLFTLALFPLSAWSQSPLSVDLKGAGKPAAIDVPAGTSADSDVYFYYVSSGSISSKIGFQVAGPSGLVASADVTQIRKSLADAKTKGQYWKLYLKGSITGESAKLVRAASFAPRSTMAAQACAIPPEIIQKVIEAYAKSGRVITADEVCNGPSKGGGEKGGSESGEETVLPDLPDSPNKPNPNVNVSLGSAEGILQKDNCSRNIKYLVRVKVSLKKVSAEALAQGFKLEAQVLESEYTGGKASSLKPVSDGKYAPNPLILMQSLGGGQWINVVRWVGNKPKIATKIAAAPGMVYWRGYLLTRTVANKALIGGKGTVELTNGYQIYGVCMKLSRARQKYNGYP